MLVSYINPVESEGSRHADTPSPLVRALVHPLCRVICYIVLRYARQSWRSCDQMFPYDSHSLSRVITTTVYI